MLVVEAHQDLAWNMLTFGRDYTQSVAQIRSLEADSPSPLHNDDAMLGWPEYQTGRVALVFATLFVSPMRFCGGGWDPLCYADASQANRLYRYQLDVYERLVDDHPDKFPLVHTRRDLQELLADWQKPAEPANENEKSQAGHPVGLIILMGGAEGVRHPAELDLIQQSLAYQAQGDQARALVSLEHALSLAEPEGYVRIFVDEGEPMAELLRKMEDNSGKMKGYIYKLLAAFGDKKEFHPASFSLHPLVEPLSERELEVLKLLRSELSGPEIAERLIVSLNTLRTHTKSIFNKLGVNNRRAAVRRAEELDLF